MIIESFKLPGYGCRFVKVGEETTVLEKFYKYFYTNKKELILWKERNATENLPDLGLRNRGFHNNTFLRNTNFGLVAIIP